MKCSNCGNEIMDGQMTCYICGEILETTDQPLESHEDYRWEKDNIFQPVPNMIWYKIILWELFLEAILCLRSAYKLFIGGRYQYNGKNISGLVYAIYGDLKVIDCIFGMIFLLMAVYAIVVHFQLKAYKKKAPALYLIYIGLSLARYLLYKTLVAWVYGLTLVDLLTVRYVEGFVYWVFLLFFNMYYFRSRNYLFER